MANEIKSSNSAFLRAAAQVKAKRAADPAIAPKETITAVVRARLNFIPDHDTLHEMVDRGLLALSRGIRWARGSIINLIV